MIQTMGFGTITIYFIIQARHTECCLYKSENKNKKNSSVGLRKCVNFGVKCWIWGEKILFWTFVSTWKLMKSKIRFDKRGPTNDVGLTCGGCRSFLNCLFKRFSIYWVIQSSSKCLTLWWKNYGNYKSSGLWCCKE